MIFKQQKLHELEAEVGECKNNQEFSDAFDIFSEQLFGGKPDLQKPKTDEKIPVNLSRAKKKNLRKQF